MSVPRKRSRLALEQLECRRVPAILTYTAPNGADHDLVVTLNGNKLQVFDNGGLVQQAVLGTVDAVQITGGNQFDRLTLDYGFGVFVKPVSFNGGLGDSDVIAIAADGDFTLTGTTTSATLTATVGSSVALAGVEQAALTGGAGNNRIDAGEFTGSVVLTGGDGNDVLVGAAGTDQLDAGEGNNAIISRAGGDDQIHGGTGDDNYDLDPGSTISVIDDGGNDTIDLGGITGGAGVVLGGGGGTVVELGVPRPGGINIFGAFETILGTIGDDQFTATNTDQLDLHQVFVGQRGNDTFTDLSHAEFMTFDGGVDDDVYKLDPGSTISVIDDGGNDTIDLSGAGGAASVVIGEGDGSVTVPGGIVGIFGAFENAIGTAFDDTIVFNSLDNNIDGGAGNDTISGGGGRDAITGGPGSDVIDGGTEDDVIVIVPGSTETVIDSGGIDTLDFSGALRGISINLGASGQQSIDSAGNKIKLVGTFENVIGTPFNDTLNGNSSNNLLVGNGGNDQLSGHTGADILIGGTGVDRLIGGANDDILIGSTTIYDGNFFALSKIQAEWTSGSSYSDRVAHLRGTAGGLNGSFFLTFGVTVLDDGDSDTLTGSQQQDWFFVFPGDTVTDSNQNEEEN